MYCLGAGFTRQHGLEDASIAIVCINIHVDDAPGGAFLAKQIAAIDCL